MKIFSLNAARKQASWWRCIQKNTDKKLKKKQILVKIKFTFKFYFIIFIKFFNFLTHSFQISHLLWDIHIFCCLYLYIF